MIILEIVSEHEIPKESNGIVTQMDVHEHFCFKQAFYNIFVHILSKYTLSVGSKSYKKNFADSKKLFLQKVPGHLGYQKATIYKDPKKYFQKVYGRLGSDKANQCGITN